MKSDQTGWVMQCQFYLPELDKWALLGGLYATREKCEARIRKLESFQIKRGLALMPMRPARLEQGKIVEGE